MSRIQEKVPLATKQQMGYNDLKGGGIHMTKDAFFNKWLDAFAKDISDESIQRYVTSTGNYLWHIFSWELVDSGAYLTGNAAGAAYDQADKQGALYMDWFESDHTKLVADDLCAADAWTSFVEVYVVGKDFAWTYIKTHEEDLCGPYFYMPKK